MKKERRKNQMSTIPDIPVNHEQQANAHIATVRQLAQSIQGFSYAARGRA
jgi:hypothetical protein